MTDKIYKGFFSGTFGKGTFDFDWSDTYKAKRALSHDYRVKSLFGNNVEKIYTDNGFMYLPDINVVYTGPFWSEKLDNNEDTIYDCRRLCYNEIRRIKESDFFVCVLTNSPSVGSVCELMTALYMNKPIAVFYELNKDLEPLSMPTRHWWAISAVQKLNEKDYNENGNPYNNRMTFGFDNIEEVYKLLKDKSFYKIIMKDISCFSNNALFNNLITDRKKYRCYDFETEE